MKIKITKAEEQDFDGVYEILMHEDVNPFMNYPIIEKSDFQKIWSEFFSRLYVWKEEEEIFGIVAITKGTHRVKHIAYIEKLAINQSLNRKGLGTIFFSEVINSLAKEGITKIELNVETDNTRAISFYKKLGFEIEGTRKNALDREGEFIDNYSMAKIL
ncbi:MAG: putative N-acetyltransferase [Rickettsiaceae bacterium]|jgi:putative acetyltransferase|nr:putative N-acetyltransferase [Rickettsiaceae bacterium]